MRNGARTRQAAAAGAMWLGALALAGGPGCGPSARQGDAGPDAGADRIILMAGSGGVSCPELVGTGGAPPVGPADGNAASGGMAGAAGGPARGNGGRGGTGGSASGDRGGTGGMATAGGRGGAAAGPTAGGARGGTLAGGTAGAAAGGGRGGSPGGTGGPGGAMSAAASGGVSGPDAAGTGTAGGRGGGSGQGGTGGAAMLAPPPAAGELAIVELLINPAGTDTGREWVEVVSRAAHALDLASLHVADAANDAAVDFTGAGTTILLPGARAVLIQSADATKNGGVHLGPASGIFGGSFGTRVSLNNEADTFSVCLGPCQEGAVIDRFAWDATLGTGYDDHALSIDEGGRRCPAPTPFGDAGSFGTPGGENPPCP